MIHRTWLQKSVVYLFYAALVFFTALFLVPAQFLPDESIFNWWDKAQHTLVFIALGFVAFLAYPKTYPKALIGLLIYGALIEVAQSLTTWRQGDVLDWIADAIGVLIIWACLILFHRIWARTRNQSLP